MSTGTGPTLAPARPQQPANLPAKQDQASRPNGLATAGLSRQGMQFGSFTELFTFAKYVSVSGFAPKGMEKPETILVALQMGMELGLPPMAALQNIAVINGRPSLWGDAQLAVVRATGEMEEFSEWYEQGGNRLARNPVTFTDDTCAVCRVKRRGQEAVETSFSVADAKKANLWGKQGPWSQYPARMLRFRGRSFGLRDTFGDALRGLMSAEEAGDSQPFGVNVGTAAPATDGAGGLNARLRGQQAQPVTEEPEFTGEAVDNDPTQGGSESGSPLASAAPDDASAGGASSEHEGDFQPDVQFTADSPECGTWTAYKAKAIELLSKLDVDVATADASIEKTRVNVHNAISARAEGKTARASALNAIVNGQYDVANGTIAK